eukprot:CAMPEP_0169197128 /NCGR_PEP_ID=MMETSP1016-20121227/8101_1 /TAXON_ID=342587 /ORGANISM="Karlodinium micrum, Strain CCMP2283" /LENGTH=175 /DNA_ID=CAMNT_0009273751 /DNA_START=189 /DNA_END=714 /DNA_ORIENTATION=+
MVGFGFMDNTVMLHAGNAIDMSLGATFGLSTLSAAACGQICSDMAGVCFGGIIERGAEKFGLPSADLSAEQQNSPLVGHVGLIGHSSIPGDQVGNASGDAGFSIMVDNEEKHGLTAVRLEGPGHVQGVIAAVTSALAAYGCRIIEINGHRDEERLCITFSLTKDGARLEDDELQA